MRRLYIAPMSVYERYRGTFSTHMTTHYLPLYDPSIDGAESAWAAAGSHVVVSTEHVDESAQELWENDPHVTTLPDPVFDGTMPVGDAHTSLTENIDHICKGHLYLCRPALYGVLPSDTILQVHKKLQTWHPAFKLRSLGA